MTKRAKLLTRDEFREAVFTRDRHACVWCRAPAVDAHHIIERKLWPDGGYYLDNGASLCAVCHLLAESTEISCDDLRRCCRITAPILPDHLSPEETYDKWGNVILPSGQRLRGELMDDAGVQKVLAPVMQLFTSRVRYPRTFHLPWSPGATSDDRRLDRAELEVLVGAEVVVTEKIDGECTTLYCDGLHARSVDYAAHPSRDRVRALHATIAHDVPSGWRLCGENAYALHSIAYDALPSYFLLFSIWDDRNVCLSWDQTLEWATLLGLTVVPVLYRGPWDEMLLRRLDHDTISKLGGTREGYVVRRASSFSYREFRKSVAKFVRKDHVVHHEGHWINRAVIANKLRSPEGKFTPVDRDGEQGDVAR